MYLYMYSNETLQTLAIMEGFILICFKRQNNCFLCLILTLPVGLSAKANEPGVDILYCISSSSLLDKTGSEKKNQKLINSLFFFSNWKVDVREQYHHSFLNMQSAICKLSCQKPCKDENLSDNHYNPSNIFACMQLV